MDELISMFMYTRTIDKKQNIKRSIGIIDEQQNTYELNETIKEKEELYG